MNKKVIPSEPSPEHEIPLREALEERYLAYALSTIMHRALPDARDGLKPVHRRILYGMRLLRLDPGAQFKKSAKIVGDVMGNFHPHGDQAIYDALVRLAQDFSSRYPLVDGQGNFGNIDGDNAAAYRYTEARLTEVARLLLDGIDEDAVDFRPNYDGVTHEPVVLPAAFPNLLANGAQGIAVGMATSIPPHNVAELCDAALYLIEQPKARTRTLLKYVLGPDFPTGGLIVDPPELIAEAYATGRGSFRLRARWKTEETGRGTYQIVVTEIPWQVQKMRLVERIAELINERKLPLLADMRDESAEDVRLVFEPRSRAVDPALLMESLFKLTELEARVPLNMNVLLRGQVADLSGLSFKADDSLKLAFFAETTSKLLVFATNGRFYTIEAAKLPGGRGHGEPIRLFIDLEQEGDIVSVFRYQGGRKLLVASLQGRGFIAREDECVANTRKGKQVLNVKAPDAACAVTPVEGDLVAAIGENRKMVIFPIEQAPEMTRGRGVRLQRYKDGGLSDIKTFEVEKGLSWVDSAGRVFNLSLKDLADWRGNRADAGRLAPKGFPKTNMFGNGENGTDEDRG